MVEGNLVGSGHGTGTTSSRSFVSPVATIAADNGDGADLHDMLVTPAGTAIVMRTSRLMDLTPYGGVANGNVTQLVIQEIDIATGTAMWEWDSLDHIPVTKSVVAAPASAATCGTTSTETRLTSRATEACWYRAAIRRRSTTST